jgi:hypothetical protein
MISIRRKFQAVPGHRRAPAGEEVTELGPDDRLLSVIGGSHVGMPEGFGGIPCVKQRGIGDPVRRKPAWRAASGTLAGVVSRG